MKSILILFLILGYYWAEAQGFYNNGAVVGLSDQTILTVPDSLVNKGTIANNGNLTISGAWVNIGTYDAAGTGQINFNSDLAQTINHSDQSFNKLVISGNGEKIFSANITIESELSLQDGVLKSANGSKIILNSGAVITGGSDQSHIAGSVEAKGAGNWIFPIGNGTVYLPVEVLGITDASAIATLTLHELTSGQTLSGDKALTALSSKRYWELVVAQGALEQSKIKLPVVNEQDLSANADDLVIAASSSPMASYASIGQSELTGDLSSGFVTSEQSPTAVFYALAAIGGDHAIEVFNAVSAGSDGKNDFFRIANIEYYPDNRVIIFNRWGDKVFELTGYDNDQKVFRGEANTGANNKLTPGTFFYAIELGDGSAKKTGFFVLK